MEIKVGLFEKKNCGVGVVGMINVFSGGSEF